MNELKGARYVGVRYPICQPDGTRIDMHAVAVDHPNGPWEAIYCRTQEQAETIVKQEALSDKLVSRVVDNMLSEAELLKKCEALKTKVEKEISAVLGLIPDAVRVHESGSPEENLFASLAISVAKLVKKGTA